MALFIYLIVATVSLVPLLPIFTIQYHPYPHSNHDSPRRITQTHTLTHRSSNMENNYGEHSSEFNPMRPFDINNLNFSSRDEQQSSNLLQLQPNPVPTQLLSSFEELESQNPGKTVNNDGLLIDFVDPKTLNLDFSHTYEPARTPGLAPPYFQELLPSQYHQLRAEWHCNAEKFHRQQAQELVELAQAFQNLDPHPELPLQDINSSNELSLGTVHAMPKNHVGKTEEEHAKKRNKKTHQHHPSRISPSGAVQKLEAPTTSLPAYLSAALMTDSNLQRHANVTNASEIHPRVFQRVMFKPETVYSPLQQPPEPWGHCTLDGQTISDRFKYNQFGELEPGDFFTAAEMKTYLLNHYLHINGNAKEGGLKLWIQRNPPDSKHRYGHSCAARCRFLDCIAQNRLINQGHTRVAFDELSCRGENLDPMHNAGYVHLYCLERFMNFPHLCSTLQVRVEDRHLPNEHNGKNKMMLSSTQEFREAKRFIENCEMGKISSSYPDFRMPNRPYEGTLNHKICIKKVAAEPSKVQKARVSNFLDIHYPHLDNANSEISIGPARKQTVPFRSSSR